MFSRGFAILFYWIFVSDFLVSEASRFEYLYVNDEISFDEFNSWSDLNGNISNLVYATFSTYINFNPINPIILTNELDIEKVLNGFITKSNSYTLNMMRLNGIEILPWPINPSLSTISFTIAFEQSQIEFYLNETKVRDLACLRETILSIFGTQATFFTQFSSIYFYYRNKYPSLPICPYIFYNAQLSEIYVQQQVNTILVKNILAFETQTSLNDTTINANVKQLEVSGYGYNLDTSLLHPLVFGQMVDLFIVHSVNSIQPDLFKYLTQVRGIDIMMDNLRNFFHRIGLAWTQSLNSQYSELIIFTSYVSVEVNWMEGSEYLYPDSDFCIFAQYEIKNTIFYVLNSYALTKCTNSIQWLISNYFTQDVSGLLKVLPVIEVTYSMCKDLTNKTIDYVKNLASKCNVTTLPKTVYVEYYQILFGAEFVEDLVAFIAIPLACLMGLFFNLAIIRQVQKNKKDKLKDKFYEYMQLNAAFNCLYCLIFLFYPVNSCADTLTSYFCSSIRQSYVTQYYKIVFIAYFGETIKMCANISYILINVNRYMLIGRDGHMLLLQNISKWDLKWVTGLSVLFSLFINIGHIWQYNLNLISNLDFNYRSSFIYVYQSYPLVYRNSQSLMFYYFLVYFVLSYVMFLFINTAVEVILVRKLHAELADKKKKMEHMTRSNVSQMSMSFCKRRKLEIEDKAEQRAIIMVVVNAFLNFVLRLPDVLYLLATSRQIFDSSNNFLSIFFNIIPSLLDFSTDLAFLCYILTFTTNFFVFYLFNLKFKQTFSKRTKT